MGTHINFRYVDQDFIFEMVPYARQKPVVHTELSQVTNAGTSTRILWGTIKSSLSKQGAKDVLIIFP